MQLRAFKLKIMNINRLEKEILRALDINSKVNWNFAELTPNQEFKELKKFVKKLFKEHKQGE